MNTSSTSLAGPLVGWLVDYYLLATLLLFVAFVGWRWVRQPAHRIMAAWVVILELIVLAVVCALPSWPRFSLIAVTSQHVHEKLPEVGNPGPVARPTTSHDHIDEQTPIFDAASQPDVSVSAASPSSPEPQLVWAGLIALGYFAGAALTGLWLCWGVVATMRLCSRAPPAAAPLHEALSQVVGGNCRPPRLLVSCHIADAVALGVLRPTIVLPVGLAESRELHTLRTVLSHEWAHVRNRDLWLVALGRCLLVLLFAHPLFWWLRRAMRTDQEFLADTWAAGDNRHAYAEELLRLIRKTAHPSPMGVSSVVGIWEGPSQLSRRIAMLLDETFRVEPTASRRWQRQALAPLVLLGIACSFVTSQPARSADQPSEHGDVGQSARKDTEEQAARGSGLSITDIVKALSGRQQQIKSATATVHESSQHAKRATIDAPKQSARPGNVSDDIARTLADQSKLLTELSKPKLFSVVLSADRMRLEEWRPSQMEGPPKKTRFHRVGVFDGNLGKDLVEPAPDKREAPSETYPLGTIDDADISHVIDLMSLSPLAVATRPLKWMERRGFDAASDSIEVYRGSVRDTDCAVVRWDNPHGGASYELWVAGNGSGAPRQIIGRRGGRVTYQIDVTEVVSRAGFDVPSRWVLTRYRSAGEIVTALQSVVRDVALNEPVAPEAFELDFPAGTVVTDLTSATTRRFIVRDGRPNREISDAEWGSSVPISQLLKTEPGKIGTTGRRVGAD